MKIKGTLLVGIAVLLGAGFWAYKKYFKNEFQPKGTRIEQIASNDRGILQNFLDGEEVSDGLLYAAVIRLSQDGDPSALKAAEKLTESSNKLLREGAAQALSRYGDKESIPLLKKLMSDKEESVRIFAIDGISEQSSPLRISTLEEIKGKSQLLPGERVAVQAAFYKMRSTPEEKQNELNALLDMARDKDAQIAVKAGLRAIQLAGREKSVKTFMVESLRSSQKDPSVKALSIRVLSNLKEPEVKERLNDLIKDQSHQVRMAVIQSLHRNCAPNRWEILHQVVKNDKEMMVVNKAIEEVAYLEREKAQSFLKNLKEDNTLPLPRIQMVEKAIQNLEKAPSIKACVKEIQDVPNVTK